MLPKELEDIFLRYSEDELRLCIIRADYTTDDLIIDLLLDFDDINQQGRISQEWTITAVGTRKNDISFEFGDSIKVESDHPLLWEFQDIQCQLYYSGQCVDVPKLFYDLYNCHQRLFDGYRRFDISFGEVADLYKPFQFSNGLLTEGPKKLMLQYADCLKQNGLEFSIIGERPAKFWNGSAFVEESGDLKVLFIGKGYIVAQSFLFNRKQ